VKNNVFQFKQKPILESDEFIKKIIIIYNNNIHVKNEKTDEHYIKYAFRILDNIKNDTLNNIFKGSVIDNSIKNINVEYSFLIPEDLSEVFFCAPADDENAVWDSTKNFPHEIKTPSL